MNSLVNLDLVLIAKNFLKTETEYVKECMHPAKFLSLSVHILRQRKNSRQPQQKPKTTTTFYLEIMFLPFVYFLIESA